MVWAGALIVTASPLGSEQVSWILVKVLAGTVALTAWHTGAASRAALTRAPLTFS